MINLLTYLKQVKDELTKVTWPTKPEARRLTYIVIGTSIIVGLYISALDLGFTSLLGIFIK